MATGLLRRLSQTFEKFEQTLDIIFGRGFPPGALCAVGCNEIPNALRSLTHPASSSLKDILDNGFLWAAPKSRRTIERKLQRRFGVPKYNWKPPVAKNNIVTCLKCGFYHEIGVKCGNCYELIKAATKEMQEKLLRKLKIEKEEKNVITLYREDETLIKNEDMFAEPKSNAKWYDDNLLQPTSQQPSDRTDVKPKDVA